MGKGGSRRAQRRGRSKIQKLPTSKPSNKIRLEKGVTLQSHEKLGSKLTTEEDLKVKLFQARGQVIEKTKIIHEREKRIQELELLVAQKDNTIFMMEQGLRDGASLRQSKDGDWYWIETEGQKPEPEGDADDGEEPDGDEGDDTEPEDDSEDDQETEEEGSEDVEPEEEPETETPTDESKSKADSEAAPTA